MRKSLEKVSSSLFLRREVGNWHNAEAQNETYLEQMLVFLKKSREMSRCSDWAGARRAEHCCADSARSSNVSTLFSFKMWTFMGMIRAAWINKNEVSGKYHWNWKEWFLEGRLNLRRESSCGELCEGMCVWEAIIKAKWKPGCFWKLPRAPLQPSSHAGRTAVGAGWAWECGSVCCEVERGGLKEASNRGVTENPSANHSDKENPRRTARFYAREDQINHEITQLW